LRATTRAWHLIGTDAEAESDDMRRGKSKSPHWLDAEDSGDAGQRARGSSGVRPGRHGKGVCVPPDRSGLRRRRVLENIRARKTWGACRTWRLVNGRELDKFSSQRHDSYLFRVVPALTHQKSLIFGYRNFPAEHTSANQCNVLCQIHRYGCCQ
jgi:hypothetical protein